MTQLWPATDSFGSGPTSAPPSPLAYYVRLVPWSTDPVHASGGTGFGYSSTVFATRGQLYNGWFAQQGPTPGASVAPAACNTGFSALTTPRPSGFLLRSQSFVDVTVTASYQVQSSDPAYIVANGATFMAGVGARVRGGSTQGSTIDDWRLLGGDGYWMLEICDTGGGLGRKFVLVRVNSGTVTRLAESPVGASTFDAVTTIAASTPRQISIQVEDESGDVRVIGRWRRHTSSADEVVLNVLDSSGSKLTSTGRVGVMLGSEYQRTTSPVRTVAPCMNWWTIDDGTDVLFREEWQRLVPTLCHQRDPSFSSGNQSERVGRSLMSAWYGDAQTFGTAVIPSPSSDNLTFLPNTDLWSFSQRRAEDARRQDRSIVGRFDSTGLANAAVRGFGIIVRATQTGTSPTSCYYTRVTYDDVTTASQVELRRVSVDGDKVIARKTGLSLGLDADILHRVVIYTRAPDTTNGPAVIVVELGGVAVALVPAAVPVSGVSVSATGVVTDASSNRVLSGWGEGFRVFAASANPRSMILDTWSQGVDAGPDEVLPRDQETINVLPEYSTTVGTLTLPTETDIRVVPAASTIRHDLDSDHVYMSEMHAERPAWEVAIVGMTDAQKATMLDLIEDARGVQGAVNWTAPGATPRAVVVHFVEDSIEIEQAGSPDLWSMRFTLRELIINAH
jgi:hypothetical protein